MLIYLELLREYLEMLQSHSSAFLFFHLRIQLFVEFIFVKRLIFGDSFTKYCCCNFMKTQKTIFKGSCERGLLIWTRLVRSLNFLSWKFLESVSYFSFLVSIWNRQLLRGFSCVFLNVAISNFNLLRMNSSLLGEAFKSREEAISYYKYLIRSK